MRQIRRLSLSHSFSLSLFFQNHVYSFLDQALFFYTFLGPNSQDMAMSDLFFSCTLLTPYPFLCWQCLIYFSAPCLGHVHQVWQCLIFSFPKPCLGHTLRMLAMFGLYFLSACLHCACMCVCIYIYIYIICLFKDGHALCMMDSHGYKGTPLVIIGTLNLGVWVCIQG